MRITARGTAFCHRLLSELEILGGDLNLATRIYESGFSALTRGDLETAQVRFEEAITLSPALIRAHTGLLRVALEEEREHIALDIAERLLALDPNNEAARDAFELVQRESTQ